MPFIPCPNAASVEVRGTNQGQDVENVLWFTKSGFEQDDLDDLTTVINGWWIDDMAPLVGNLMSLREIYARGQRTEDDVESTEADGFGTDGTFTGVMEPNNVTYAIAFRTGYTGRANRGRNFINGLTGNTRSGNTVDPSWVAQILTAYEDLAIVTQAIGWIWSVVSRYLDGEPRIAGAARRINELTAADSVLDSQRRRLPGRGL